MTTYLVALAVVIAVVAAESNEMVSWDQFEELSAQ